MSLFRSHLMVLSVIIPNALTGDYAFAQSSAPPAKQMDAGRQPRRVSAKDLCHVASAEAAGHGLIVRFNPPAPNAAVSDARGENFKSASPASSVKVITIPYGGRAITSHVASSQCLLTASQDKRRPGIDVSNGISSTAPGFDSVVSEFVPARARKSKVSKHR